MLTSRQTLDRASLRAVGVLLLVLAAGLVATNALAATAAKNVACVPGGGSFVFAPAEVDITAGQTVEWDCDWNFHNMVSDDGLWTAPTGTSPFQFTFNQPGTFAFHCTIHAGMTGKVVVGATGAPGAPGAPQPLTVVKHSVLTKSLRQLRRKQSVTICVSANRPVKRRATVVVVGPHRKTLFRIRLKDRRVVDTATAGCKMKAKLSRSARKRLARFRGHRVRFELSGKVVATTDSAAF